jgi:agmatinase
LLDIDVLHPAFLSRDRDTGGRGLTNRELLRVPPGLTELNLVAVNVAEVAPAYDHAEITAIAATTVIFDLIRLFAGKSSSRSGLGSAVCTSAT